MAATMYGWLIVCSQTIAKARSPYASFGIDAGTSGMSVTLSVTNGTLTVTGGTATISGSGTNTVTLTGTATQINATLGATVNYGPTANFNGSATLTMTTSDLGNTGSGGALTDVDTVTITVNAVNDAPVNTQTGTTTVTEDVATAITNLSVNDVDAGSGPITVTLSILAGGSFTVAGGGGVTASGTGTSSVTLSGTAAAINAYIAGGGLLYTTAANAAGMLSLIMPTNDGGNTGTGGTLTDTDTFAISITPVNDAPVNTVTTTQTTVRPCAR